MGEGVARFPAKGNRLSGCSDHRINGAPLSVARGDCIDPVIMNEYSLLLEIRTFRNPAISVGVGTGEIS
jgi:hypothetical protein